MGTVFHGDWRGIKVAVKSLMKSFDEESVQYHDFIKVGPLTHQALGSLALGTL